MNKPQIFDHQTFGRLPVVVIDGVEWFGATEAAKALSFSDPHKAIINHVDEDDSTVHPVIDSLGRTQQKKLKKDVISSHTLQQPAGHKSGDWWTVLADIAKALNLKAKRIRERLDDEVVSTDHNTHSERSEQDGLGKNRHPRI